MIKVAGFAAVVAFVVGCGGAATETSGNTPECFVAHGCVEEMPCVSVPGDGGANETCWVQYGEVADTSGKVGLHPVDLWVCPAAYADECAVIAANP